MFYHVLLTSRINDNERVYNRVSKLASEQPVNLKCFLSIGISSQQVYSLLLPVKVSLKASTELAGEWHVK